MAYLATVHLLIDTESAGDASDIVSVLLTENGQCSSHSGVYDWRYIKVGGVYPGPQQVDLPEGWEVEDDEPFETYEAKLQHEIYTSIAQASGALEGTRDKPLGLSDALEEVRDDVGLGLYECEIGLFDLPNDPRSPSQTFWILVASGSVDAAADRAKRLCEETIPVVAGMVFDPMSSPNEVDESEFIG